MRLIILPGYSLHNYQWANNLKKDLKFKDIYIHKWRHWKNPKVNFSEIEEVNRILKKVGNGKVNIIAKSVGTRVTMRLLSSYPDKIGKVVLCGIPTKGESEGTYKKYQEGLNNINIKNIIIIQNTHDPFASFDDIKKFIGSINPKIKIIEKPRSDHHYPYPTEIESFLKRG